ncbi:LysR family transcriptional regulator [Bordetella tumbae]|uniref:LysR family transcriptional regulator n=1 Tax=Bordetella tumbae TaxID=1649139 RepID=UPI0039EE9AA1
MTLKQLEAFYWAAICKNFAIAANRLNISVSSLSKRIGELETSLGAQLFNRSARTATLTPLGDHLLPHAKELLRGADLFMQQAGTHLNYSGRCCFGVGELTSWTWMPQFIEAIQRDHPDLRVEPFADVGHLVEDKLEEGELDFAIIGGPSSRPAIASSTIGQVEFSWVGTPRALGRRGPALPAQLSELTLVTLPQNSGVIRILDEWLTQNRLAPGRTLSCNSWGAVAGIIRQGLGVGFLPSAWAQLLCQRGEMVPLAEFPPLTPLQYCFEWRRDDTRPMLESMRKLAVETIDFHAPSCMI